MSDLTRDQKRVCQLVKLVLAGNVSGDRKERFHREAKWVLRAMARKLEIQLARYKIHSNMAGPAVCGETYMMADGLYVCMSADYRHLGVLYRKATDKDQYGTLSENHWLTWPQLDEDFEVCIWRVKHLIRFSEKTKAAKP